MNEDVIPCFSLSEEAAGALNDLQLVIDLTNQTVGDAISDMLLVEVVLSRRGWDVQDWINMYCDLPNRLLKVKVRNQTVLFLFSAIVLLFTLQFK